MTKQNTAVLLVFGGMLCLGSLALAAENGTAGSTPAPKVTGPVAVTGDSVPFLQASRQLVPLDLSKAGYVEQEYIVAGNANVYDWNADGSISVKANGPYVTRILVRRPADAAKFSGHVVVEPLFTARRFDWAMIDGYVRDSLIERGDAWVGVTLAATVKSLQKFNPTRYASLSYANPNPTEACAAGPNAPPATSDQEDGLRWDVLSQVGVALKNGSLDGFKAQYIYMTTQGGDIQTYAAAINPHTSFDSKPVYDGFVLKSPGAPGRIRRCSPAIPRTNARMAIKNIGVPIILVAAQGEVSENYSRPDSDDKADRFRIYEFAGAAHIDTWAYRELPSMADQATSTGTPAVGTAEWPFAFRCNSEMLLQDHPLEKYVLDSTFANLEQWVAKGIAPPRAERIQTKDGKVVTDQYGNGMGGIRSPYVDVPVATYLTTVAGPGNCREFGRTESFDWAKREALYGSAKNYAAKVSQDVDKLVKDRWLTASDGAKIKAEAAALK